MNSTLPHPSLFSINTHQRQTEISVKLNRAIFGVLLRLN